MSSRPQETILADLSARRGYLCREIASHQSQIDWVRSQPGWEEQEAPCLIIDQLERAMASLSDRESEIDSLEANIRAFYGM